MWYLESGLLGDYGMGRVQKELLRVDGVFDIYIGDKESVAKYTGGKTVRQLNCFRRYDVNKNINVFHFPYNAIPRNCQEGIAIVTIHDIIPLRHKTYSTDMEYEEYKRNITWTVNRADYILTVSEASQKDIMDYFDIEESRITVVYNPVNEFFCKLDEEIVSDFRNIYTEIKCKRIVLTMANKWLYKNLRKTIEAFGILNDEDTVLVVIGNLKERKAEYVDKAVELGLIGRVVFTGNVSDEELRLWYNAADMFVFPSLMEGFGLPPAEAMACGTPVITSDISSLPEVVGDAAILVNPNDEKEIAGAMRELLDDKGLCDRLTAAGYERVKLFSAEKYRENMKKFYEKVADDIKSGVAEKRISQYECHGNYMENELFKMNMLYEIAVYWLELKNKNISVSEYFLTNNCKRIVIYGMGKLAKILIEDLNDSDIDVLYGIDRDKTGDIGGIPIYAPDMVGDLDMADVYVITTPYIYGNIDALLQSKLGGSVRTIGIDEIIYDL